MRGDSLRDLYAKALALLGLGLLGAAGALVDYWPVPSALPAVASVLDLPAAARMPPLRLTAIPESSAVAVIRPAPAKLRASAASLEELTVPNTNGNDAVFGLPDGQTESLEPVAVLPPSLAVASASMTAMPVSTLALLPPVITAFEATPENPLLPEPVPAAQNRDNRFTGAAKSIGRAGVKPITAIASGFVSLASAVGHVLHL